MLFILSLFLIHAHAADSWFCTDESGKRNDNVIYACGVGESTYEHLARKYALDHAIEEFKTICDLSSDCRGRKITVEPKRMTCISNGPIIKCYRLIEVQIADPEEN